MPIIRDIPEPDPQLEQRRGHLSRSQDLRDGHAEPFPACTGYTSHPNAYDPHKRGTSAGRSRKAREELIARIKQDRSSQKFHASTSSAEPSPINITCHRSRQTLLPSPDFDRNARSGPPPGHTSPIPVSGAEPPRSALHAGDFQEQVHLISDHHGHFDEDILHPNTWTSTSPTDPWYTPSLPTSRPLSFLEPFHQAASRPLPAQARSRTGSQSSLSSSFVYRPPTSPLARGAETNDWEDRARSKSPTKASRRRTFSPGAFRTVQNSPVTFSTGLFNGSGKNITPLRRSTNPSSQYQHHPRRSITTLGNLPQLSTSNTTPPRTRRKSLLADGSPLQAPMVGGYEESILRGRMSTLPSRPVDFVAQIGVLGMGKCKASLKCPPHLSIPFPAVFYNYGNYSGQGHTSSDGPSPYVGLVDLEAFHQDCEQNQKRNSHDSRSPNSDGEGWAGEPTISADDGACSMNNDSHRSHRKSHTTSVKKIPPGGYRIPQRGQLQIVIKNPNKTAVKLFLIPYDLDGMEPGQKTFIRQRSYSAGPVIDMPLSARKNYGTDRPEASLSTSTDPKDRPMLRYLIHLHICCTSRGRFYLYNVIRVVFANRVPDGKEKLRNEIQLPEPRYSTYKPGSEADENQGLSTKPVSTTEQGFESQHNGSINFSQSLGLHTKLQLSDSPMAEPIPDEAILFDRKPLPKKSTELSSNSSLVNDYASRMQSPTLTDETRPSSSGGAMEVDSSFQAAEPEALRSFNKTPIADRRSNESSQSPKNGLLSLQLRDLVRKENPDTES